MSTNLLKLIETLELIVENGPNEFDQKHLAQDVSNPAVALRVVASELLDAVDVKKTLERISDWEVKVYGLREALGRYPEDVWWKTHQSHLDIVSGFIVELRQLNSDPVRQELTGPVLIRLYDELKIHESKDVPFDSLYDCWQDVPTDTATNAQLKRLRVKLLPHKLTISISLSKRTAKLHKKKIGKGT